MKIRFKFTVYILYAFGSMISNYYILFSRLFRDDNTTTGIQVIAVTMTMSMTDRFNRSNNY